MQEINKKKSNFFDKILQIIDYYEIKNVNSFACDYLGYKSMEKINRLQKEGTTPSYQILFDISNKFENINANWLLTGKGEMLNVADEIIPIKESLKDELIEVLRENRRLQNELSALKKITATAEDVSNALVKEAI